MLLEGGQVACPLFRWKKGGILSAFLSNNHHKVDFEKVEFLDGFFLSPIPLGLQL